MKWLRANGCPWNGETVQCAEERGHDHIAEWARANGCPKYEMVLKKQHVLH